MERYLADRQPGKKPVNKINSKYKSRTVSRTDDRY